MPKKRKRKRHTAGGIQAKNDGSDISPSSSQEQKYAKVQPHPAQAEPSTSRGPGKLPQPSPPCDAIPEEWKEKVEEWFPNLLTQTYFLPPVFMKRIQLSQRKVGNRTVNVIKDPETSAVKKAVLEKDAREDETHVKVLYCLEKLSEHEVMLVISKLNFRDYLSDSRYESDACKLPRPTDSQSPCPPDGDFDVLIIHRKLGILTGELKTVGDNVDKRSVSQEKQDEDLAKKITQANKQLKTQKQVLEYLVSTDSDPPRIRTTLMLPNIASHHLQRVLEEKVDESTKEGLCQSLGVDNIKDAVNLCLTAHDLEKPEEWWKRLTALSDDCPAMTESLYLDLVSRFGGPATIITVPTVKLFLLDKTVQEQAVKTRLNTRGNGVAEAAKRVAPPLAEIVLNHRQVNILTDKNNRMVYLSGPPGTGKTVVLLLKALTWLSEEKVVQVVSSAPEGQAAAHMIFTEVKTSAGLADDRKIKLHCFDLTGEGEENVKSAEEALVKEAVNGELNIIADEMCKNFNQLCLLLNEKVQTLHVWAASVFHEHKPSGMKEELLREALRTTPRITREVAWSGHMSFNNEVYTYTASIASPPCEGPLPTSILHDRDKGHTGHLTYECSVCGEEVAKELRELRGKKESPLNYRNMIVLTTEPVLNDDMGGSSRNDIPVSGFLQGLKKAGIPYRMLTADATPQDIKEVATMTGPDQVVVTDCRMVSGLERPVVVWVHGDTTSQDEHQGRLHAISRCTAQLIWVRPGHV